MNVTIYPGSQPGGINFDEASTVTNISGATVSYSDTLDPFVTEGTITVGSTVTLVGSYFFRATETTLLSHVPVLTGSTDARVEALTLRVADAETQLANAIPSVLDHGVDNVGLVDQAAAIAALAPGAYALPADGFIRLATDAVVPVGVNFIGQDPGYDADDWATGSIFRCTTSSGRLTFASGNGGLSSNFMVDGNGVATNAMKLNTCLNRAFVEVLVRDSTGDNLVIDGAQNNTFTRLQSLRAGAACVVLDNSAGSNYFHDSELYYPGTYHIVSRQSLGAVNPEVGVDYPLLNVFDGGIAEYATTTTLGCVYHSAGNHLRFTNGFNFSPGDTTATANPAIFRVENQSPAMSANGDIIIDGIIALGTQAKWTFLDVVSGQGAWVMHVLGYNYAAHFLNGFKYATGIVMPVNMQGHLRLESTTNRLSHPDTTVEYALLYGTSAEGMNWTVPNLDDPTVRIKRTGDAADRLQARPDGVWFGPGNATVDAGVLRTGAATVAVNNILEFNNAVAAADAPLYSLFIDSADLLLKHERFDGVQQRVGYSQQAANPDTSGATLTDLETEVNQLKAALRAAGILAT